MKHGFWAVFEGDTVAGLDNFFMGLEDIDGLLFTGVAKDFATAGLEGMLDLPLDTEPFKG